MPIVALSCLSSSCFLQIFEVMGAFLWEIKSIIEGSGIQSSATLEPFRQRKPLPTAGDGRLNHSAVSPFSMCQHILLRGLQLTPTGINKDPQS